MGVVLLFKRTRPPRHRQRYDREYEQLQACLRAGVCAVPNCVALAVPGCAFCTVHESLYAPESPIALPAPEPEVDR